MWFPCSVLSALYSTSCVFLSTCVLFTSLCPITMLYAKRRPLLQCLRTCWTASRTTNCITLQDVKMLWICRRLSTFRGVARIFGLGADHVVWSPTLPAPKLRSPCGGSGSSPRRILLIRMPEMHFPSIWHHHHNLSNHEVQQLTFIPLLFLTLSKLQIFLQSYLLIHWHFVILYSGGHLPPSPPLATPLT